MSSRRVVVLCILLAAIVFAMLRWRDLSSRRESGELAGVTIDKQPVVLTTRSFDPAAPPADMPPLGPGEDAECDSNFLSHANVGGEAKQTDATHATVTITQIKVTLQLNVTIWVPTGVTQHVIEHENGHRQISEYYYQNADKLAGRIAGTYMGKQVEITGADLPAELSKFLQQTGSEISEKYNRELDPEPAQLLYDNITSHSRNGVVAQDAVTHALKNVTVESPPPAK